MKVIVDRNGEQISVEAEWIGGQLWYHLDGETRIYAPEQRRRSAKADSSRTEIHAPMPGKITKLLKKVGESVSVGEVVVVMEAMKMEYSLKAEVAGTMGEVSCQPGDQVSLGQKLARIETAASERSNR